ncbi:MAG: DJ-1/PfpI family protein [Nitrococcus mobilis]|nr:DJ-1/PfpI family protein [Nitrococcus mobilis]
MAHVLVPLAEGCEELEAVTVIDLLRRAGIDVVVAGLAEGAVKASRGVVLVPDVTLDAVLEQDFDMIVLPGGAGGAARLEADARLGRLLRRQADTGRYIAAICAAPKVLAAAGLLAGRRATSFPGYLDQAEGVNCEMTAVVVDGRVVTSRGPGTALDFALNLIALLLGERAAREVEAPLQRPIEHLQYR